MEGEEQPKPALTETTPILDKEETSQTEHQVGSSANQVAENPVDNPLTRIPDDIEKRVGAPKNYAEMSMEDLRRESHRLSTIHEVDGYWNRELANKKLAQSFAERREKDIELLRARLDTDVPEGYVRVYRGEDKEGLGQYGTTEPVAGKSGKWFSTDLGTAAAFAENLRYRGRIRYMDIPQSDFEALIDLSRTKTDIQVPVGYDVQAGSKVLMPDGSIPPESLETEDDNPTTPKESDPPEKPVQTAIQSNELPKPSLPTQESLGAKISKLFTRSKK